MENIKTFTLESDDINNYINENISTFRLDFWVVEHIDWTSIVREIIESYVIDRKHNSDGDAEIFTIKGFENEKEFKDFLENCIYDKKLHINNIIN